MEETDMTTATAARPASRPTSDAPNGTPKAPASATLDQVILETEKRRSIVRVAADKIGVSDHRRLFDLLRKQWPQKDAPFSDEELFQAVSLIARYDLDPLAREIYCSRDKRGRIMVIVAIDGWIKILHRTEGYDGHEQSIEWDDKGQLFSATTTIHSTQRKYPVVYVAFWKEYAAVGGFVKDQMPSHMLRVFSLRHAARQFAPIGANVVTEAEALYMASHSYADDMPVERKPVGNARNASEALADILESKHEPSGRHSGSEPNAAQQSDDSGPSMEGDVADDEFAPSPYSMGELEDQPAYVGRIKKAIVGTLDPAVIEQIEIAASASEPMLGPEHIEAINRALAKRREQIGTK